MKREILFRGKNGDVWIEGFYNHYKNDDINVDVHSIIQPNGLKFQVIPETVGQFTGLLDKNGVKIFEGDICEMKHPYRERQWEGEITYFKYMFNGENFFMSHLDIPDELFSEGTDYIEVTGNIHDQ